MGFLTLKSTNLPYNTQPENIRGRIALNRCYWMNKMLPDEMVVTCGKNGRSGNPKNPVQI
jgi:hypothetical protein